jgi:putative ABC transport system permease protein
MSDAIREWLRRVRATFHKAPEDADMEDELRLHVNMIADALKRRGLSFEDAARQARLQAGGIAQVMEQRRDQRGLRWLEDLIQDLRYGVRTLRRAPVFTAVTIATLTLAIGANTAAFSLVDPLLFRDLPVRDPGSLVQFTWRYPGDPPLNLFSLDAYAQYRDRSTMFSDMVGVAPLRTESSVGSEPIGADIVTGNFFLALGVRPALGRVLDASDDTPGGAPTAVVSWRHWHGRFGGEARVLGAIIDINDRRLPVPVHATVVGVAASDFSGVFDGGRTDVWVSLGAIPAAMRSRGGVSLMARLKPEASIAQAQAEMRVLHQSSIDELAQRDPQWRHVAIDVTSARTGLSTPLTDQFGGPLSLLMAIVGILLLLACANIGGLLLARGASRQQEMAVRVSLGAGRLRMMRQVLAESLLLASLGAALGLAGAPFGATILTRIMTSGTQSLGPPPRVEIALDARVLTFTIGVTLLAALVFGLAPAIAAFVSAPASALRQGGGAQTKSRRVFGNGLVVAQVAISLALLSVSQLYVGHLRHLRDRSLGFDRDRVLLMSVNTSRAQNREQLAALYRDVVARLHAIPGVDSVAASGMTPMSGAAGSAFLRAEGFDEPAQDRRRVSLNTVSPNYFLTYGTPLLAGRDFRDSDMNQPRRIIVNQALARKYFPGRDPIGRHVWLENERDPYEIVGVAGDAKYQDVRLPSPPIVYQFALMSRGSSDLSLRTSGRRAGLAGDARRLVNDVLGSNSVGRVTTLAEQVDASIVPERLLAALAGFFGAVGALLAAIGLFGLLAYTVARQTKEIGIRMALGATRGRVSRMVATSAGWLVSVGVLLGAPTAFWSTRFAARSVENLPAGGAVPIASAAAALIAVAFIAVYVPARRATRVEPIIALRAE